MNELNVFGIDYYEQNVLVKILLCLIYPFIVVLMTILTSIIILLVAIFISLVLIVCVIISWFLMLIGIFKRRQR